MQIKLIIYGSSLNADHLCSLKNSSPIRYTVKKEMMVPQTEKKNSFFHPNKRLYYVYPAIRILHVIFTAYSTIIVRLLIQVETKECRCLRRNWIKAVLDTDWVWLHPQCHAILTRTRKSLNDVNKYIPAILAMVISICSTYC